MARSLAASQAGANGSIGGSGGGVEKSLAAAIAASAELRLPDELAARAQRQTKICMPQVRRLPFGGPLQAGTRADEIRDRTNQDSLGYSHRLCAPSP